jgi:hypothetical protein
MAGYANYSIFVRHLPLRPNLGEAYGPIFVDQHQLGKRLLTKLWESFLVRISASDFTGNRLLTNHYRQTITE